MATSFDAGAVALKVALAERVRTWGLEVKVVDEPLVLSNLSDVSNKQPNVAPKDFASLRNSLQVERLMGVEIGMLGMERASSAYVPTSDPRQC